MKKFVTFTIIVLALIFGVGVASHGSQLAVSKDGEFQVTPQGIFRNGILEETFPFAGKAVGLKGKPSAYYAYLAGDGAPGEPSKIWILQFSSASPFPVLVKTKNGPVGKVKALLVSGKQLLLGCGRLIVKYNIAVPAKPKVANSVATSGVPFEIRSAGGFVYVLLEDVPGLKPAAIQAYDANLTPLARKNFKAVPSCMAASADQVAVGFPEAGTAPTKFRLFAAGSLSPLHKVPMGAGSISALAFGGNRVFAVIGPQVFAFNSDNPGIPFAFGTGLPNANEIAVNAANTTLYATDGAEVKIIDYSPYLPPS